MYIEVIVVSSVCQISGIYRATSIAAWDQKRGRPFEAMENTLVNHASLFKTLLFTDKFCHIFGTLSSATRVNNLEEFRVAKLAFDNLLELQADKNMQEHQDDDLAQFMDEVAHDQRGTRRIMN